MKTILRFNMRKNFIGIKIPLVEQLMLLSVLLLTPIEVTVITATALLNNHPKSFYMTCRTVSDSLTFYFCFKLVEFPSLQKTCFFHDVLS